MMDASENANAIDLMISQVRQECKDGELKERGFQEGEMDLIGYVLFLTIWKSNENFFFFSSLVEFWEN